MEASGNALARRVSLGLADARAHALAAVRQTDRERHDAREPFFLAAHWPARPGAGAGLLATGSACFPHSQQLRRKGQFGACCMWEAHYVSFFL